MPGSFTCRPLRVPDALDIKAALSDVIGYLTNAENWEGDNAQETACVIAAMLQDYYEGCMIGAIFASARDDIPPHCLPCDGGEYDGADYPALYEVLAPEFKTTGGKFVTPDLRGLFVLGASASRVLFSTGGAETVQLTADQNGPHTHTTQPHAHTEITAITTVINGGLEAPASAAVPSTGSTGASTVTVDSSGDGEAHENMPPYMAMGYFIIAE